MLTSMGRKLAAATAMLGLLLTATLLTGGFGLANADNHKSADTLQASALTAQEALPENDPANADVDQRLEGGALLAVARQVEETVPLPPGGSFDDIDWEAVESTSTSGVRSFVEYNASCDWYRYLLASADAKNTAGTDRATEVLGKIAQWPSFRGTESGTSAAAIAAAAVKGDLEPARQQVKVNCG